MKKTTGKPFSTCTVRWKPLHNKVFERLFAKAEIAKMSKKDRKEYDDSLKNYRDMNALLRDMNTLLYDYTKEGIIILRSFSGRVSAFFLKFIVKVLPDARVLHYFVIPKIFFDFFFCIQKKNVHLRHN